LKVWPETIYVQRVSDSPAGQLPTLKPDFHSNESTHRTQGHTYENYAVKIKSTQGTQETQENYASEKQKHGTQTQVTKVTQAVLALQNKNRIDPIFHARNANWQPIGIEDIACVDCVFHFTQRKRLRCVAYVASLDAMRALCCVRLNGNQAMH